MASRTTIPVGIIVAAALFVFLMLYFSPWNQLEGKGVSETDTKTTVRTEKVANGPDKEITETNTVVKPTWWTAIGSVAIPLIGGAGVAILGLWFNREQRKRQEAVENLHAQDNALQAYLDQMSDLLVTQNLRAEKRSHTRDVIRDVAQARTIAVLLGLDREHKRRPLKLVQELGLISKQEPILRLENAGLDGADLSELSLREANLSCADLRVADLRGADLSGVDLSGADLRGADLTNADLSNADLTSA